MSEPVILTDLDERGVATVTLNRPSIGNAYDGDMLVAMADAFAQLEADSAVRVVALRGNGRHFSVGADINWLNQAHDGGPGAEGDAPPSLTALLGALDAMARPTVALVHGACIGGGLGWAACCDIAVASRDAFFAIPEVRIGFSPAPILPYFDAALGARALRRYALSGERFDAEEAYRLGLVHGICPTGGLDEAAAPIIDSLLLGAPSALGETKRLLARVAGTAVPGDLARELERRGAEGRASAEAAEGRASFLEKRRPDWYPG